MASRPDRREPIKINEITANQPIPDRYLEQILTSLRRSGIVQSQRGARGGYLLTREPWQITLLEIVSSIEGDRPDGIWCCHCSTACDSVSSRIHVRKRLEVRIDLFAGRFSDRHSIHLALLYLSL
ncbi:hypothetical protein C7B61_01810 [filamentous cyanobacterium CCP1]|nr:hypothetical protein C7B76_12260 [filamentous cyanobacterium CCP2]PSB68264.1 hypothetical protein C7B61_01810 [filamentous cyanobacterium CCP1]